MRGIMHFPTLNLHDVDGVTVAESATNGVRMYLTVSHAWPPTLNEGDTVWLRKHCPANKGREQLVLAVVRFTTGITPLKKMCTGFLYYLETIVTVPHGADAPPMEPPK